MSGLVRLPDWPERLAAALDEARSRPFAWGAHDCGLFACDLIRAMTGADPACDLRGSYASRSGACRALRRLAGGGLEPAVAALAERFVAPEIPPVLAQRGDACLLDLEHGLTFAICCGTHAAAAGPEGLAMVPMARARRAWRIG